MGREPQPTKTQLYLVLELTGSEIPTERLDALLAEFAIPSLLIVPGERNANDVEKLRPLVLNAQQHGTAVLIADDLELAGNLRADGVHLSNEATQAPLIERFREARETLGANAIIGADAGQSRHEAMAISEAEADYVAFSPDTQTDQSGDAAPHQLDLVEWWAEIFEPPIVALGVADNETAADFAAVGADFVARTLPVGKSPADLRQWMIEAQNALGKDGD